MKTWVIRRVANGDVHVVPPRDDGRHQKSRFCHCGPSYQGRDEEPLPVTESEPVVVLHRAFDGRE